VIDAHGSIGGNVGTKLGCDLMTGPVRLAVVGAGQIGQRHIKHIVAEPKALLAAIVDPSEAAKSLALQRNVPWFAQFSDLLAAQKLDGVIFATPNQLHVANGLEAVAAGIPALIEKPIADDLAAATRLVAEAEAKHVPLLIGHHRRHNSLIQRAKTIIDDGMLGRIVSVHGCFWLLKPDDYFDVAWRREDGAGPILTNLIHDIDLLRYLVGEIVSVQAQTSNAVRGHAVEETAVAVLQFANGALGTVNVSDSIVAPWSWEHTTGENPQYPQTDQFCYMLGGTHGSLTVPTLEIWSNAGKRSWFEPFTVERINAASQDPLGLQIQHFCRVIRGEEAPLVSGREGLQTLRVIDAIKRAAREGRRITLAET
jgi:predicted dehydrogenase